MRLLIKTSDGRRDVYLGKVKRCIDVWRLVFSCSRGNTHYVQERKYMRTDDNEDTYLGAKGNTDQAFRTKPAVDLPRR